jgi:hypothetical protein
MAVIYGEGGARYILVRIEENLKGQMTRWGRRSLGRSQKMHGARWTWELGSDPKSGGYFDGDYIQLVAISERWSELKHIYKKCEVTYFDY